MSERYNLHDKSRAAPSGGTLRSNRPLLALRAARPDCFRSPAGQNAPQDRFVSPVSSPVRLNQTQRGTQRVPLCVWCRWWDSPLKSSFACSPCCAPGLLSLPGRAKRSTGPFCFPRLRVPFDLTKHRGTQRVPLCLVPVVGLEPTRYCYQRILSPSRLPIPSHRRICSNFVHISV